MSNLLESLHHRFLKGRFLGNVLVLVGGTAFSQALLFLASPLITRLYQPSDFGVWSLIKSFGAIFAVVASWRYELSIVLPKKDKDAANLFVGSVLIAIAMSGLLLLIISLLGPQVVHLLSIEEILPWLWILPLILLLTGIYYACNYWSTRKQHFRSLAISRIVQSLVMVGMQISLTFIIGSSSSGLILGAVFGQIAATGALAVQIWIEDGSFLLSSLSWKTIKNGIYKYKRFPLYVTPYSFIGDLESQMVVLLLAAFTTTKIVGLYGFSKAIVLMPISLISASLNQVFFPKASRQLESGNLGKFVTQVLSSLVFTTTPLFAFFIFNNEWLFTIFFGNQWTEASTYATWLALSAFMGLHTAWLDRIYDVLSKQHISLLMNVVYILLSMSGFTITLIWFQQPVLAVAVYSLISVIYECLWLKITFALAKFPQSEIWQVGKIFISIFAFYCLLHWMTGKISYSNLAQLTEITIITLYYGCLGLVYYRKQNERGIK